MNDKNNTVYQKWDIFLARVQYEDINLAKMRPVLVLNSTVVIVYALKMTSQPPRPGEYTLLRWKEAGLNKPTVVRISKKLQLCPSDMIKKTGRVHPVDQIGIRRILQNSQKP